MSGIMALDLSSKSTGVAVTRTGAAPLLQSFPLSKAPVGDDLGRLYRTLWDLLHDLNVVHRPELIWFEAAMDIARRSQHTARMLFGLATVVELFCAIERVGCFEANVNTVRPYVLGSRKRTEPRSWKQIALDYCSLRKWTVPDDDAADAAVLWVYAYACAGKPEGA